MNDYVMLSMLDAIFDLVYILIRLNIYYFLIYSVPGFFYTDKPVITKITILKSLISFCKYAFTMLHSSLYFSIVDGAISILDYSFSSFKLVIFEYTLMVWSISILKSPLTLFHFIHKLTCVNSIWILLCPFYLWFVFEPFAFVA